MLFRNGKDGRAAFSRGKTNGNQISFAKGESIYRVAASLRAAALNLNFHDL
jgi:hypothetical protein